MTTKIFTPKADKPSEEEPERTSYPMSVRRQSIPVPSGRYAHRRWALAVETRDVGTVTFSHTMSPEDGEKVQRAVERALCEIAGAEEITDTTWPEALPARKANRRRYSTHTDGDDSFRALEGSVTNLPVGYEDGRPPCDPPWKTRYAALKGMHSVGMPQGVGLGASLGMSDALAEHILRQAKQAQGERIVSEGQQVHDEWITSVPSPSPLEVKHLQKIMEECRVPNIEELAEIDVNAEAVPRTLTNSGEAKLRELRHESGHCPECGWMDHHSQKCSSHKPVAPLSQKRVDALADGNLRTLSSSGALIRPEVAQRVREIRYAGGQCPECGRKKSHSQECSSFALSPACDKGAKCSVEGCKGHAKPDKN
jgi:hypothetical protein